MDETERHGIAETAEHRIKYQDLPCTVRQVVDEVRHNVHAKGTELYDAASERYADLIEAVGDAFNEASYTHFHLSRSGDIVFTNNNNRYGQAFKRLWNVHLPLH